MSNVVAMPISFAAAGAWIAAMAGGVWAIGAFPTWLLAGRAGLAAQAVAGGIVMVVMTAGAALVVVFARGGISRAVSGFMAMGVVRMGVCLGGTGLAIYTSTLPRAVLLVWTGVFYLAMISGEGLWLSRAVRRAGARRQEGLPC